MKSLFLTLSFLLSISIDCLPASLKSQVNECFELTSIVFRLADAPEYINNDISSYANDIDTFFLKHKNHKLIHFLKDIREEYGISYNAVAAAAAQLEVKKGKVVVRTGVNISQINEADDRWTKPVYKTFVTLLNDFYKDTKFHTFYLQHIDLYNMATERMDKLLLTVNTEWLATLYKNEYRLPSVIVSLSNGANNYAFSISGINSEYGIVIGSAADSEGQPTYNPNKKFIIIHELLHHYTNDKIANIWPQINESAKKIYSYVKEDMERNAYGDPQIAMSEWFTDLLTIMYENNLPPNDTAVEHIIRRCQNKGFIWMGRSVSFMKHYKENQTLFPSVDDYIPQIIGFINYTAENFEKISNEYNNREPYIVDIFPASGSELNINLDNTIEIRFSEPMLTGAHGLSPATDETIQMVPFDEKTGWKDEYTYILPLKKGTLNSDKAYGFRLNHLFFQSKRTYSIKDDYMYTFKTYAQ